MSGTRQRVLAGVLVGLGLLAAVVLFDVLETVFFAVTVAYVLAPLHRRLVERGVHTWWASAASTAVGFLGVGLLLGSFAFLVYRRQAELLELLRTLPESASVELFGVVYAVDAGVVFELAREYLTRAALSVARAAPVLALKGTLFVMLVFALLVRRGQVGRAMLAPLPPAYRDVAAAFHERTRETLAAIYVLQAATAATTFGVALPFFFLLGYDLFVTLALVAGFLQFLPIVGPSVLVGLLAVYQFSVGDLTAAALVAVLGAVLVGWLPDAVVRPRLARHTADIPGSLYFIGFTGGVLSVGAVGFIAGPLVVALLVEAADLLATEVNGHADEIELTPPEGENATPAGDGPAEEP